MEPTDRSSVSRARTFKNGATEWTDVDRTRLARELAVFDGDADARRVVARQAGDLADAGRYEHDFGAELTVETVVANLRDAPADSGLVERWNWWVGSLELSHGGYEQFRVRRY